MNQRRGVLAALGLGMMLASLRGVTQAANKIYRVACFWSDSGLIVGNAPGTLKKTLREFGYVDGQLVARRLAWFYQAQHQSYSSVYRTRCD